MRNFMYFLLYLSLSFSNDKTYTLTEFDIQTINSFRETGFSSFADFTVINNLMNSDFYSTESDDHFGMYYMCYYNDDLTCANKHLNRAIQIDGKQSYYDLSDSLSLYRDFLENARRAVEKENFNIGIEDYENIIERFPGTGMPYYELGVLYDKIDNKTGAITNFKKAITLNPNKEMYRTAIYSIAQSISKEADNDSKRQDYNSAIPKYLEAISYYPEFTQAYFQLAKAFYSLGDYNQAKDYLLKCLELNPNQLQPLMMIATIYKKLKDNESSERYYKKAIQVDPGSYKAHFRLGTLLMRKDLKLAKLSLEETVRLNDKYYNGHETLGIVNMQLGNINEAINNFMNTIDVLGERSKKRYKSLYLLADIYNTKKEYDKAKEYAQSAVDIRENGGAANYHLGIAYKNLGENYLAKNAFERASKDKDWRASAKYELELMKK